MTIVYPHGRPTFWDLISLGLPRVVVRVRELPIPGDWFASDYTENAELREGVQAWMRRLWDAKDETISGLLLPRDASAGPSGRSRAG